MRSFDSFHSLRMTIFSGGVLLKNRHFATVVLETLTSRIAVTFT